MDDPYSGTHGEMFILYARGANRTLRRHTYLLVPVGPEDLK